MLMGIEIINSFDAFTMTKLNSTMNSAWIQGILQWILPEKFF